MKKNFTIVACLTLMALLHAQNTIFVTPNGTGNGTSWETACNLEEAILVIERSRASAPLSDQASLNDHAAPLPGTQIWVQSGTYYPSKMLVIPDSVKIYGGFSGTETMLSQRLVAANPVIVDGQHKIGSVFRLGKSVELNGLTIQNGNANGNTQKNGGGVWADENCVIANCIIINNTATLNGGGIYANGKVEIINTTIKDNTAMGNGINIFGNCLAIDQTNNPSSNTVNGCFSGIYNLGTVSFLSSKTWIISGNGVHQEWSDAVIATNCNKTSFNGGSSGSYHADCRANADRSIYGDYFSWCAVACFAHVLCPDGWRVPTDQDFCDLDKALGGFEECPAVVNTLHTNTTVRDKYVSNSGDAGQFWGGSYGGFCFGSFGGHGSHAEYWAVSEENATNGFRLSVTNPSNGGVNPYCSHEKSLGLVLRCVK